MLAPRGETRPSFRLDYYNGTLMWRDFGHSRKPGDVISFVQYYYLYKTGEKLNYYQAISRILQDVNEDIKAPVIMPTDKPPADIKIKYREGYARHELDYWKSQRISLKTLRRFDVFPAEVWINGKMIHTSKEGDPLFVYLFGEDSYKLYRPYGQDRRFLEYNARDVVQGFDKMFDHHTAVVTKSYKDVMGYYEIGIPACAPQAESEFVGEVKVALLKRRYKNLFINYDPDPAGRGNANHYSSKYDIPAFYWSLSKDLTENRIDYGDNYVIKYLEQYGIEPRSD